LAKLQVKQANFVDFIEEFPDEFFDGIVLDLGFSSNQLSSSGRGFSYQKLDEVVDLRYDDSVKMACWQKLNLVKNPNDLGNIIYRFSGEKLAQKISANILTFLENLRIETRQKNPQISVKDLVDVISMSIPAIFRKKTNQILSRVWQALRIWTNDELEVLESFLPIAVTKLAPGGKLAIVSFHSLEDKIVASFMRDISIPASDEFGNKSQDFQLLTTRSVVAGEMELTQNSRSRSAMLRVLERLE
jgi:16S rRNA (cytosine1402-N4)-methyltransferase